MDDAEYNILVQRYSHSSRIPMLHPLLARYAGKNIEGSQNGSDIFGLRLHSLAYTENSDGNRQHRYDIRDDDIHVFHSSHIQQVRFAAGVAFRLSRNNFIDFWIPDARLETGLASSCIFPADRGRSGLRLAPFPARTDGEQSRHFVHSRCEYALSAVHNITEPVVRLCCRYDIRSCHLSTLVHPVAEVQGEYLRTMGRGSTRPSCYRAGRNELIEEIHLKT